MSANDRITEITQLIDGLKDKYPALTYLAPLTKAVDEILPETQRG